MSWSDPRPFAFVNGCHTTAVRPDQAFDLVSAFVQHVNAAGVIGTEITVGEALATRVGHAFLRRFVGRETAGEAMRHTRLELLSSTAIRSGWCTPRSRSRGCGCSDEALKRVRGAPKRSPRFFRCCRRYFVF